MRRQFAEDFHNVRGRAMNSKPKRLVDEILFSGFKLRQINPYFLIFDAKGTPWKNHPSKMNRRDIVEYVHHKFGDRIASDCAQSPSLNIH